MKKILLLVMTLLLLCVTLIFPSCAADPSSAFGEEDTAVAETILGYMGVSARVKGDGYGIRSVWNVNKANIAALEAKGYTVTVGAIMGISEVSGNVINATSDSLTVIPKDYLGVVTENSNAAALVVYATGGASYASDLWLTHNASSGSFAFTTTFKNGTAAKAYFEMKLVYRGYVILAKDGNAEIFYTDAVPTDGKLSEQISLLALSSYFMNDYDGVNAALYKTADKICEVVAMCGSAYSMASGTCTKNSMLLSDGKSVLLGSATANKCTVTVDVIRSGFYRIEGLVNYNAGYVDYIYCNNGTASITTSGRLGTNSTAAKALNDTAEEVTAVTATAFVPFAYTYLYEGKNTLTFYASRYVAVSDFTLSLVSTVDTERGDVVMNARDCTSYLINNTSTAGSVAYTGDGILLRADANGGKNHAIYTFTPTVSGEYKLSFLAAATASLVSATVTATGKDTQYLTASCSKTTTTLGESSSSAATILPDGKLILEKGVTYSLTLKPEASGWFYVRKIALCLQNELDEDNLDNEQSYEVLFKNMTTIPSNATLLDDGYTYYMGRANGTFGFSLTVPEAGLYGIRMKYVNTVGDTTYRTQFYTSSTQNPEYVRSRIAGDTTAYSGDTNAFVLPVAERKAEYTETVGYQYLSAGTNNITFKVENSTYATGFYGIEYYPLHMGEDIRMTADDQTPTLTLNPSVSDTDRELDATAKNLFLRTGDTAEWSDVITVTSGGIYYVHSLVATNGSSLTYTFTNSTTGESYTSSATQTGGFSMGGSSTSLTEVTATAVLLPAGTYSLKISFSGSWLNFADLRLTRDAETAYLASDQVTDAVTVTPEKDGYYELTARTSASAKLGILMNESEIAVSDPTGTDDTAETRTLTKIYLRKGTTYRFALQNYSTEACVTTLPVATYHSDRSLSTGYFVDMDAESAVAANMRYDLTKGNVTAGVGFVDASGSSYTVPTLSNTSETNPHAYVGTQLYTNATDFGYAANVKYNAIKMKDGTGAAPLGITFTVETAGTYDITVIYSTASTGSSAKIAADVDNIPDGSKYTVIKGEAARNVLHAVNVGSYELTAGTHTLYVYNCGSYTFWLQGFTAERADATDFTFTPEYPGDYRVTAYLAGGEAVTFTIDAVTKGNEAALFTGDCYATAIPESDSETAVLISRLYTFMTDVSYTVRIPLPLSRITGLSFDLVSMLEAETIHLSDSDYVGTVTEKNTYTDTSYAGFSKYTSSPANYADYGYTSSKISTWRTQDKNSGNKVQYDPIGINISVPESGYYELSLVYITSGNATVSAYLDGDLTNGYWSEGPTVNTDTSRLEGTWVPYTYDVGSDGQILTAATGVSSTAGSLASVSLSDKVYIEEGEHILYLANTGTYSLYMADVVVSPVSVSSTYKDFTTMCYASYDAKTKAATASVTASGRNSMLFPGYTVCFTAYDQSGNLLGTTTYEATAFETNGVHMTLENVEKYHYGVLTFTDPSGVALTEPIEFHFDDYRVTFLSDTHLYDWEDMFFDSSAQRTAWAVQSALKEHAISPIDAVVIPGDVVNNYLHEYEAGVFDAWEYVDEDGVTHTSVYKGVSYPAGSSGTENDPLGVLRILSFVELVQPLVDAGIPVYAVHGNHDCYRDTIFEMGFRTNQTEGYLGGALQYEMDEDGNLLVPDYKIEDGAISLYTKTVAPTDDEYEGYSKGYGKDYAFELNDATAFMAFDNFYNRNEDPTYNGFISNSSGRSWGEAIITEDTVNTLVDLTAAYGDVYVAIHSMTGNQPYLKAALTNTNITAVFDGHTHVERALPDAFGTGKYVFTCGYFGVPMYDSQKNFQIYPFSYRMLEKNGDSLRSFIVLPEKDYPEYTFKKSSGAYIPAFYQPYFRRKPTIIR